VLGAAGPRREAVAVVIGNDRYLNMPADRQLQKAVNDANAVAAAMNALGFEVLVGANLGRQGMIDKLAEFTARLEPGDTAAFFLAGHGVATKGVFPGRRHSDLAISKLLVNSEPGQ
jgi:uncharacterized caspase-like protein